MMKDFATTKNVHSTGYGNQLHNQTCECITNLRHH